MELKIKNNEKNFLEFNLIGERHTFANLLKSRLLKNSEVDFVSYKLNHPMDNEVEFVLRTKSKEPKKVLLEACEEVSTDLKEFREKIQKAMK